MSTCCGVKSIASRTVLKVGNCKQRVDAVTSPQQLHPEDSIEESGKKCANTDSILTSEIISLIPHAHVAVCTHGDWPDLSAVSERYHVIL